MVERVPKGGHDDIKNNDKNLMMYLQIPLVLVMVGLVYIGWRCVKQRRMNAGGNHNNKEVLLGFDHEIPLDQSM